MEVALGPGRALEGVAPVHEGTLAHACTPSPLDGWQPAGPPLQVLPAASWSLERVISEQSSNLAADPRSAGQLMVKVNWL